MRKGTESSVGQRFGCRLCLWRVKQDSCLLSLPPIFYPGLFQGAMAELLGRHFKSNKGPWKS